jgi:DNA-directed RNA polymerase specialized sigma24 family protein
MRSWVQPADGVCRVLRADRARTLATPRQPRPARPRACTVDSRSDDLPDIDLQRALRRLPARQREAVVLHYWADLGVEACATAMGLSPGSVMQHLSRARRRLASDLGEPPLDLEVEAP